MDDENQKLKKNRKSPWNFIVFAVLILGFILIARIKSPCACGSENISDASTSSTASVPDSVTIQKKENGLPLLLDFGAEKCRPCQMLAPILAELEKEYAGVMDVRFVDVWKPENAAKAKRWNIQSIPTQIFFDAEGKELWRHVGFISKADILKKWRELGYDLSPEDKSETEKRKKMKHG